MKKNGLIYDKSGKSFPGIPARDLSPEEIEKYGGEEYLLSTGLYSKPIEEKKSRKFFEEEKE